MASLKPSKIVNFVVFSYFAVVTNFCFFYWLLIREIKNVDSIHHSINISCTVVGIKSLSSNKLHQELCDVSSRSKAAHKTPVWQLTMISAVI